ncbi:response regulator [Qipengyuania sediminis]|uniref:response regulator n=1 Tax=Qipengyuania sediminis TaxID=1532023 RepID=UPI001404378B|nr:response regulator [Qipengyuania sediminis]
MTLAGRTVLILEDELIIAFALEDMLVDLGAEVRMASTVEEGFAQLGEAGSFSLAVLDVNVQGHKSYPVAEELQRRGVPLIFATGYGDAEHPSHFASTPTLTKPYNRHQLVQAIEGLL